MGCDHRKGFKKSLECILCIKIVKNLLNNPKDSMYQIIIQISL